MSDDDYLDGILKNLERQGVPIEASLALAEPLSGDPTGDTFLAAYRWLVENANLGYLPDPSDLAACRVAAHQELIRLGGDLDGEAMLRHRTPGDAAMNAALDARSGQAKRVLNPNVTSPQTDRPESAPLARPTPKEPDPLPNRREIDRGTDYPAWMTSG